MFRRQNNYPSFNKKQIIPEKHKMAAIIGGHFGFSMI